MALSETMVGERWPEVKSELRRNWSKLSDEELERTGGDIEMVSNLIQQRYGSTPESYNRKVLEIFNRFDLRQEEEEEEGEVNLDVENEEFEGSFSSSTRPRGAGQGSQKTR